MTIVNEQPIPSFERPILASNNMTTNDERKLVQLHCKEEIIKWLISILQTDQPVLNAASSQSTITSYSVNTQLGTETSSVYETNLSSSRSINSDLLKSSTQDDMFSSISDQFGFSLGDRSSISSFSTIMTTTGNSLQSSSSSSNTNKQISQKIIQSSTLNVNLVHEILRNVNFV